MKIEQNVVTLAERLITAIEEMGLNQNSRAGTPGCLEKLAMETHEVAAAGHDIADAIRDLANAVRSK